MRLFENKFPWNRALLNKLTVTQTVKKFSAFYGTGNFITVITKARHLSQNHMHCMERSPFEGRGDGPQIWRVAANLLNKH